MKIEVRKATIDELLKTVCPLRFKNAAKRVNRVCTCSDVGMDIVHDEAIPQ